jgi:hypothetical protein
MPNDNFTDLAFPGLAGAADAGAADAVEACVLELSEDGAGVPLPLLPDEPQPASRLPLKVSVIPSLNQFFIAASLPFLFQSGFDRL